METKTVKFDNYEVEAGVKLVYGCPGDYDTAPTRDHYELTGKYILNDVDISSSIAVIDYASKGELTEYFSEQIND